MTPRLAKGSGTYLVEELRGSHVVFRCPKAELLGPAVGSEAAAADGEEPGGAAGEDA